MRESEREREKTIKTEMHKCDEAAWCEAGWGSVACLRAVQKETVMYVLFTRLGLVVCV